MISNTWDQIRSAAACTMFIGCKVASTSKGASSAVTVNCDEEPMCMQTTVPSDSQIDQKGSQCELCRLGYPSFAGFSENDMA